MFTVTALVQKVTIVTPNTRVRVPAPVRASLRHNWRGGMAMPMLQPAG